VTAEDDTSVANDVKLPILEDFHQHIYNPNWHFSCMYQISPNNNPNFALCYRAVPVDLIMLGLQVARTTTKC
jgi:hypothetical protein